MRPRRVAPALLAALGGLALAAGCATQPPATPAPAASPTVPAVTAAAPAMPAGQARILLYRFRLHPASEVHPVADALALSVGYALVGTEHFVSVAEADSQARRGDPTARELVLRGTVMRFDADGTRAWRSVGSAVGSVVGVLVPGASMVTSMAGSLAGSVRTASVAVQLELQDMRTGQTLATHLAESWSKDLAGSSKSGMGLVGPLQPFSGTPMEQAIRGMVADATRFVLAATPAEYFRDAGRPPPVPAGAPTGTASADLRALESTPVAYVVTAVASLRDAPSSGARTVAVLRRGTPVRILEDRLPIPTERWFRVRLDDGRDGWIAEAVTSLTIEPDAPARPR
jgi:hypothetical protein